MRKPILIGNWKMHKTIEQARAYAGTLIPLISKISATDIVLAPPFTALSVVAESIKTTPIGLAGQDVHWEPHGAFTGAISPIMLADHGCQAVIIGHSERRRIFYEDNTAIRQKIKAALEHNLTAILCLGETQEERDTGKTSNVLSHQLESALDGTNLINPTQLIIAYEPIWAIGCGTPATPSQANDAHEHLRKHLSSLLCPVDAESIRIIYGGSITAENINALMSMPHVDGGLVGGACLDPANFAIIVNSAVK